MHRIVDDVSNPSDEAYIAVWDKFFFLQLNLSYRFIEELNEINYNPAVALRLGWKVILVVILFFKLCGKDQN